MRVRSVDELYGSFDTTYAISLSNLRAHHSRALAGGTLEHVEHDLMTLFRGMSPYLDYHSGRAINRRRSVKSSESPIDPSFGRARA